MAGGRKSAANVLAILLWPASVAAQCALTQSGPVVATRNWQQIHDLDIWVTDNRPGVSTNGHIGVSIYSVRIHHKVGPAIYIDGYGSHVNAVHTIGTSQKAGSGVLCYGAYGLQVDNMKSDGENQAIQLQYCDGSDLTGIEGRNEHDAGGVTPYGGLVQWLYSNDGRLDNFSNWVPASSLMGGDIVNAWNSNRILISNGSIDGAYGIYSACVQDDEGTSDMYVSDVDCTHWLNTAFSAYGAYGDTAVYSDVRARDSVPSSRQGVPSSGQSAFIGPVPGPGGKTNVAFDAGVYWGLSNPYDPVYNQPGMVRSSFYNYNFVVRVPFKANVCP